MVSKFILACFKVEKYLDDNWENEETDEKDDKGSA